MRVPLTVNDFLYRAEAVSAYAAAVAAGEHFLRRASPKVMRVGLAGGAFPLLGCSVGCSGAARRSSRRAVALRTVLDRGQGGQQRLSVERCRSVRAGRPGREGVRPGGSR